jgi:phosphoglycolate phosphatase
MAKYIVFDFDGTIADTHQDIKNIVNDLKKDKDKEINFEEIRDKGTKYLIKRAKIPFWRLPKLTYKVLTELRKRTDIKLFPEIINVFKQLNKKYKLGIVSSNSKKNINEVLKKHKVQNLFDFIYSDSSLFGKHRVLKRMLKKYNLTSNDVIYVGDEDRDIIAAKKTSIKVIAVTWGYNSEKRLCKENPNYLVKFPKQLIKAISNLSK